jgi:hypothetical protein
MWLAVLVGVLIGMVVGGAIQFTIDTYEFWRDSR